MPEQLFRYPRLGETCPGGRSRYQEMYRRSVDNPEEFWANTETDRLIAPTEVKMCPTTRTMCTSAGTTTVR